MTSEMTSVLQQQRVKRWTLYIDRQSETHTERQTERERNRQCCVLSVRANCLINIAVRRTHYVSCPSVCPSVPYQIVTKGGAEVGYAKHTLLSDPSIKFYCYIFICAWLTINSQLTKIIILHCFDAIFKSRNAPNSKFSGAPPRTSLGELTALPQTP